MEDRTAVCFRSVCTVGTHLSKLAGIFLGLVLACGVVWGADETQWSQQLAAELAELKARGIPLTTAEFFARDVPEELNAAPVYMQVFHVHWDIEQETTWGQEIGGISDEEANRPHAGAVRHQSPENRFFDATCRISRQLGRRIVGTDEALEWCQVSFRMSQHAASAPTLVSQLVAIAMQQMTLNTVEEIISEKPLAAATASRFADLLGGMDLREGWTRTMIREMTVGRSVFQRLRKNPAAGSTLLPQNIGGDQQLSGIMKTYCSEAGRPLWDFDELMYVRVMRQCIEASALPSREARAVWEEIQTDVDAAGETALLTRTLVPALHKIAKGRDYTQARIDVCRIAFALKAHKHIHGAYPEDLAELQKGLSWQLPKDVFTGDDFAYKSDGEGFVLHSEARDDAEGLLVEWTAEK